jgi:hypothetical protein
MFSVIPTTKVDVVYADVVWNLGIARIQFRRALVFGK